MRFRPARKLLSAELPQQALDIPGIIGTSVQWGKGSGVVAASGVAWIEAAAALTLRPYLAIRKRKKIIITIIIVIIVTITTITIIIVIIAIRTIITIIIVIIVIITKSNNNSNNSNNNNNINNNSNNSNNNNNNKNNSINSNSNKKSGASGFHAETASAEFARNLQAGL